MQQTLLLKFWIRLENSDLPELSQHHGPLFHRWLPDGEKDAIVLDTGNPDIELKVWFERWGFVNQTVDGHKTFILFSYERREVDPERISWQALLEAGPLIGTLRVREISNEDLSVLREERIGDKRYVQLGKKAVQDWLFPPIDKFINVLRLNYGQYWLKPLRKWDSRWQSLGHYCSYVLELHWSLDEGKTWEKFVPNKPTQTIEHQQRDISLGEYLSEKDWRELGQVVKALPEHSLASNILVRAHHLLDQSNLQYAVIEGVTALELAIHEFVRRSLKRDNSLLESVQAFWILPRRTQAAIIGTASGRVPCDTLQHTIKAIDLRNKIVHDGRTPSSEDLDDILGLLNAVAALLPGPRFRFPSARALNKLMPPEKWEQQG